MCYLEGKFATSFQGGDTGWLGRRMCTQTIKSFTCMLLGDVVLLHDVRFWHENVVGGGKIFLFASTKKKTLTLMQLRIMLISRVL